MLKFSSLFAVTAALILSVGCQSSDKRLDYIVVAPYVAESFKRREAHGAFDYMTNYKRSAYDEIKSPAQLRRMTPDKEEVLTRHGQPDFVRDAFKASLTGELVDEWIYHDRQVVVQFVGGRLVYEGEMSEMDTFRLRFGYPNEMFNQPSTDFVGHSPDRVQKIMGGEGVRGQGVSREIWVYYGLFTGLEGMVATFSNEELVSLTRSK
ncbi:MAG: hypothetical protein JJU11_03565 [Candidatus Sumerlaeia bacterium]|nr:hypothetical protein [Candidatus Sumerlaeia bacterium]